VSVSVEIPGISEKMELIWDAGKRLVLIGFHNADDISKDPSIVEKKLGIMRSIIRREGISVAKSQNLLVEDEVRAFRLDFQSVDDLTTFLREFSNAQEVGRGYVCTSRFDDNYSLEYVRTWIGAVKDALERHGVDNHRHYHPSIRSNFNMCLRDGTSYGGGKVKVFLNSLEDMAFHLACLESQMYAQRAENYLIDRHVSKKLSEPEKPALLEVEPS